MTDNSKEQKCDYNDFRRVQYFHGMLMTDSDFTDEQGYHMSKRKLLNRMLHGTGVVCGLKMEPTGCGESSKIIIRPGLALDCAGNEIFVPKPYELDVIEMIKSATGCETEVKIKECETRGNGEENKWYVVVRYQDVKNSPVPVYAPAGDCGMEKVCEYSRIKEGYCFEMYRALPQNIICPGSTKKENGICNKYMTAPNSGVIDESKSGNIRQFLCEDLLMPCPDICCDNQPVVLGSINFKEKNIPLDTKINSSMINNWDCRTYVITFGLLQYWMKQLAPAELPFNAIINYALLKDACKDETSAVEYFKKICGITKGT